MKFFLETQLIKSSCTYQPLSFCKILKILLEPIQSYGDVSFLSKKWNICSKQNIFGTQNYYQFHLPIGPFQCAKVLKNSYSRSRIMRMCHFWAQNGPFAPNKIFFWKILNITLIYLLASFIAQNFKKNSSSGSRIMRMHNFWNQNDPFPQMRIFLGKPVHEPCFFHSCLSSTCQKLKSNINLLVKY